MPFLRSMEVTIRSRGINIPKGVVFSDTSLKLFQSKLHYFPIAGKDGNGFDCLYVDFTDVKGFLKFIERTIKRRESFKDDSFFYQLDERFKYFDHYLKETIENPGSDTLPNLMKIPKSNCGRIFFGDLVKHILEPEKVLVMGQMSHIQIYELEQGEKSLRQYWEKLTN